MSSTAQRARTGGRRRSSARGRRPSRVAEIPGNKALLAGARGDRPGSLVDVCKIPCAGSASSSAPRCCCRRCPSQSAIPGPHICHALRRPGPASPECSGCADWRIVPRALECGLRTLFGAMCCQRRAPPRCYSGLHRRRGQRGARRSCSASPSTSSSMARMGRAAQADALRSARLLYWAAAASALFACVDFYYPVPRARRATDRNSCGSIPESTAARRGCSTRPARWATSARSSW